MQVYILGVRGSRPAPGPEFVRYGGHTACVAISRDGEASSLILDAGTGITRVTDLLNGDPFRGSILLGHLHWDHTHGLPFFRSGDHPEAEVEVWMPTQEDPVAVLEQVMSPPHFPIGPQQLHGSWSFNAVKEGWTSINGFDVLAREIPHKGGQTFGYRITDGESTVAYLSDHGPIAFGAGPDGCGEYHGAAVELTEGVDLLIHDAQYDVTEFDERLTWGHSSVEYAVCLGDRVNAGRVLMFHHDPGHDDDAIDELDKTWGSEKVTFAREGTRIDL